MISSELRLPNVHEVLGESRFDDSVKESGEVCAFRVPPSLEEAARTICEANQSDLSKFLRGCMRQLVADYR